MNCPKCHAAMEDVAFDDIHVQRCTQCRGMLFQQGDPERLAELDGSDAIDIGGASLDDEIRNRTPIQCPTCSATMVKMVDHKQPHIWYEMCSTCGGIFFDAGEFTDFKHHTVIDFFRDLTAKPRM